MSHMIETIAYRNDAPWHKLGTRADEHATDTRAFIEAAGMGWTVRLERLALAADGRQVAAYAVVRASDNAVLGDHVGPQWTPVQNAEAFQWFDPFLKAAAAKLETA